MTVDKNIEKQLIYYYRNGFSAKAMSEKTGLTINQIRWRLKMIKRKQKLVRWWEES